MVGTLVFMSVAPVWGAAAWRMPLDSPGSGSHEACISGSRGAVAIGEMGFGKLHPQGTVQIVD